MEAEILNHLGLMDFLTRETGLTESEIITVVKNNFGGLLNGLFGKEMKA